MDIEVYEKIKSGLISYFESLNISSIYKPKIASYETSGATYPLLVFMEVRNTPYENYRNYRETVANLGYRVDIFAKTSGSIAKDEIARNLAKYCNDYLTCIGLKQMSYNVFANDGASGNGELYHITMLYNAPYLEQRQFIL